MENGNCCFLLALFCAATCFAQESRLVDPGLKYGDADGASAPHLLDSPRKSNDRAIYRYSLSEKTKDAPLTEEDVDKITRWLDGHYDRMYEF